MQGSYENSCECHGPMNASSVFVQMPTASRQSVRFAAWAWAPRPKLLPNSDPNTSYLEGSGFFQPPANDFAQTQSRKQGLGFRV